MALVVVEDGTGVPHSNTFITRAQAITYASDRGVDLTDDTPTDVMILKAGIYLIGLEWKGNLADPLQAMPWPRKNVYLPQAVQGQLPYFGGLGYLVGFEGGAGYGEYGDGYTGISPALGTPYPDNTVPPDILLAQNELVMLQNEGFNINPVTGDQPFVLRDTVGPITTEYSDRYGPVSGSPEMPTVDTYLARWLIDNGGSFGLRARRG